MYRLLSYLAAFTYGGYVFATVRGVQKVELYQWLLTGMVGTFFFLMAEHRAGGKEDGEVGQSS